MAQIFGRFFFSFRFFFCNKPKEYSLFKWASTSALGDKTIFCFHMKTRIVSSTNPHPIRYDLRMFTKTKQLYKFKRSYISTRKFIKQEYCGGKWHFNWYNFYFSSFLPYLFYTFKWSAIRANQLFWLIFLSFFLRLLFTARSKCDHKRDLLSGLYN